MYLLERWEVEYILTLSGSTQHWLLSLIFLSVYIWPSLSSSVVVLSVIFAEGKWLKCHFDQASWDFGDKSELEKEWFLLENPAVGQRDVNHRCLPNLERKQIFFTKLRRGKAMFWQAKEFRFTRTWSCIAHLDTYGRNSPVGTDLSVKLSHAFFSSAPSQGVFHCLSPHQCYIAILIIIVTTTIIIIIIIIIPYFKLLITFSFHWINFPVCSKEEQESHSAHLVIGLMNSVHWRLPPVPPGPRMQEWNCP